MTGRTKKHPSTVFWTRRHHPRSEHYWDALRAIGRAPLPRLASMRPLDQDVFTNAFLNNYVAESTGRRPSRNEFAKKSASASTRGMVRTPRRVQQWICAQRRLSGSHLCHRRQPKCATAHSKVGDQIFLHPAAAQTQWAQSVVAHRDATDCRCRNEDPHHQCDDRTPLHRHVHDRLDRCWLSQHHQKELGRRIPTASNGITLSPRPLPKTTARSVRASGTRCAPPRDLLTSEHVVPDARTRCPRDGVNRDALPERQISASWRTCSREARSRHNLPRPAGFDQRGSGVV